MYGEMLIIFYVAFVLILLGVAVSLIVLMWAAIRALNAITDERRMNMALLMAEDAAVETE
jgi:hypothetical protein